MTVSCDQPPFLPDKDLQLLLDAGQAAAEIARKHFKTTVEIWDKGDNQGPVTAVDLEIDRMLRAEFATNRPDYAWLSEESDDDPARLHADRVFIVDPIDGTRSFIAGQENFAISIAIAHHGQITHGVVNMPVKQRVYCAHKGGGAWLNNEPLQISQAQHVKNANVLIAKKQFTSGHWRIERPPIKQHFRSSLAYRLSLVAQGRFDAMLTLGDTWEWDVAAGDIIVTEAGGSIADRKARSVCYNNTTPKLSGFCAANLILLPKLLAYID